MSASLPKSLLVYHGILAPSFPNKLMIDIDKLNSYSRLSRSKRLCRFMKNVSLWIELGQLIETMNK
jgi:hypothetical protein